MHRPMIGAQHGSRSRSRLTNVDVCTPSTVCGNPHVAPDTVVDALTAANDAFPIVTVVEFVIALTYPTSGAPAAPAPKTVMPQPRSSG